jgi:rubrerythrin
MSWGKLDEKTEKEIKQQKEFEEKTAKSLTPIYEQAQNPLIKTLIHSLILDTMKHAEIYQMLLDLNTTALVGKESEELGEKEIAKHLKEEAFMLKQTAEISKTIKDKHIKEILTNIMEDEEKHHRILIQLQKMLKAESKEWDAYIYDLITGFP